MIAAFAVLLGGSVWAGKMWRLRRQHLQRVARHDRGLRAIVMERNRMSGRLARPKGPATREQWVQSLAVFEGRNRPWVAFHEQMKAKYLRAARYPWLSVAPDPPTPG